jgi:hypothetical protein
MNKYIHVFFQQERRRQLASNVDPENIETLITVRDELSIENKKLRQIMVAKEKSYLKEREQTTALVSEKSLQITDLTNEVQRLNGELGDASRLTEMLRSQVCPLNFFIINVLSLKVRR